MSHQHMGSLAEFLGVAGLFLSAHRFLNSLNSWMIRVCPPILPGVSSRVGFTGLSVRKATHSQLRQVGLASETPATKCTRVTMGLPTCDNTCVLFVGDPQFYFHACLSFKYLSYACVCSGSHWVTGFWTLMFLEESKGEELLHFLLRSEHPLPLSVYCHHSVTRSQHLYLLSPSLLLCYQLRPRTWQQCHCPGRPSAISVAHPSSQPHDWLSVSLM